MTDYTIDRGLLSRMGFQGAIVVERDSTVAALDQNSKVMHYLRKVVPKMFQATLPLLTTATIQLFLDELIWRELYGRSPEDAFHNMVADLGTQTGTESSAPVIRKLSQVPFLSFLSFLQKQFLFKNQKADNTDRNWLSAIIRCILTFQFFFVKCTNFKLWTGGFQSVSRLEEIGTSNVSFV